MAELVLSHKITDVLTVAVGFVIALALNSAMSKTFALIPFGDDPENPGGAWVYAVTMILVGLLLIWLMFRFMCPGLSKVFGKKNVITCNK